MKFFFTLLSITLSLLSFAQSSTVVISQVYGGGGANSGTPSYKNDYIELYNKSNTSQDISGFVVAYGSATGQFGSTSSNFYTIPTGTTILPGKYLLIQLGSTGTAGSDFPVTPDLITTNISAAAANGKFALFNTSFVSNSCGATATPCTLPSTSIVDLVAYGTANNAEGGAAVGALSTTTSAVRKQDGVLDTDNNANDFEVITNAVPRNSAFIVPLNLTFFNASLINKEVALVWKTTNENNVDGFIIEKSNDARNFKQFGFVAAKNTANATYSCYDVLEAGVSYYRLKMIDKDGSFKYSSVVVLTTKQSTKLEVFPNPIVNTATLAHEIAGTKATIKVVNLEGKNIFAQNIQTGATQTSLDVSKLIKGNYLIVFENEGSRATIQFVKQ